MVKIYGSYRGLFVFMILDDYRVCVKKKEFLQTPFCCDDCDVRWCRRTSLPLKKGEGTRIGGDVVSYVKYAIAAVYDDEERKKICRACYRLLGVPHNIRLCYKILDRNETFSIWT